MDPQMRKLFFRGFPSEMTEDDVRMSLSSFGEVEDVLILKERVTRASRGCGFVTFCSIDTTLTVLENPSYVIAGRPVNFNFASDKSEDDRGKDAGTRSDQSRAGSDRLRAPPLSVGGTPADRTLRRFLVRGIPFEASNEDLAVAFRGYGELEETAVVLDKTTQQSRGFGFVIMRYLEGAQALALQPPTSMGSKDIKVSLAEQAALPQLLPYHNQGGLAAGAAGYPSSHGGMGGLSYGRQAGGGYPEPYSAGYGGGRPAYQSGSRPPLASSPYAAAATSAYPSAPPPLLPGVPPLSQHPSGAAGAAAYAYWSQYQHQQQ